MTRIDHILHGFSIKQLESLVYILNKTKVEDMDQELEYAELLIIGALHLAKGGLNEKG